MDQVEDFLTDQDVQESWKFEDFGGQKLLADHVENIRVEWSASYPSRAFATATKRFLFYKHLGMGIYNDMEDEDEEGGEEEESTYERRSARPRRAVRFSPRIFLTFL